jgi:hypothetical protein
LLFNFHQISRGFPIFLKGYVGIFKIASQKVKEIGLLVSGLPLLERRYFWVASPSKEKILVGGFPAEKKILVGGSPPLG